MCVCAPSIAIDDQRLWAARYGNEIDVSRIRSATRRQGEDFYPLSARFGDPNLASCRDVANVVGTGGERRRSDNRQRLRSDDIEPLRVPICCEQESTALVC